MNNKKMKQLLTSLPDETMREVEKLSKRYQISKSTIARIFIMECLRCEVLEPEKGIKTGLLDRGYQDEYQMNRGNWNKK